MNNIKEQAAEAALAARKNAYAPYSGFFVGAAVVTEKGHIYTGANIENSSYGATVCAERAAIFSAVSAGDRDIVLLAIAAEMKGAPAYPCGICRQVAVEFNPDMSVILVNAATGKIEEETTIRLLLPHHFVLE